MKGLRRRGMGYWRFCSGWRCRAAGRRGGQGDGGGAGLHPEAGEVHGAADGHDHHRHGRGGDLLHDRRLQPVAPDEPGLQGPDQAHRHRDPQGVRLQEGAQGQRHHLRRLFNASTSPPPPPLGGRRHALPRLADAAGRRRELGRRLRDPDADAGPDRGGAALLLLRPHRPDHQPARPRRRRHDPLRHRHHAAAGRRLAGLAHPAGWDLRHARRSSPRCAAATATSTSIPRPTRRARSGASSGSRAAARPSRRRRRRRPSPGARHPATPRGSSPRRPTVRALDEISALQPQGFDGWLNQQFALPVVSHLAYLDAAAASPARTSRRTRSRIVLETGRAGA